MQSGKLRISSQLSWCNVHILKWKYALIGSGSWKVRFPECFQNYAVIEEVRVHFFSWISKLEEKIKKKKTLGDKTNINRELEAKKIFFHVPIQLQHADHTIDSPPFGQIRMVLDGIIIKGPCCDPNINFMT